MPASPWSKFQRDELFDRYRKLRSAHPTRFEALKEFVRIGAEVMHWPTEGKDWTRRSLQLADLFETFEKEAKKSPVPPVPDVRYVPTAPTSDRPMEGPPRLGFWDLREMRRQLKRAPVLAKGDYLVALADAVGRQDDEGFKFPDLMDALDRREREVYRRFGLEPPRRRER